MNKVDQYRLLEGIGGEYLDINILSDGYQEIDDDRVDTYEIDVHASQPGAWVERIYVKNGRVFVETVRPMQRHRVL